MKIKKVRLAIRAVLAKHLDQGVPDASPPQAMELRPIKETPPPYGAESAEPSDESIEQVLTLVKSQHEY